MIANFRSQLVNGIDKIIKNFLRPLFSSLNRCLTCDFLYNFSEEQPSISGSNDSTSLDSRSYIAPFHARDQDVESHASLIPAPRSTTVSINSSLENVHIKSSISSNNMCTSLPEVSCDDGAETVASQDSQGNFPNAPSPSGNTQSTSTTSKGNENINNIVLSRSDSPTVYLHENEQVNHQMVAPCAVPEDSETAATS